MRKINYTFILWRMAREYWDTLPWWDKVRAWVFFKVILPKSRLEIIDRLITPYDESVKKEKNI